MLVFRPARRASPFVKAGPARPRRPAVKARRPERPDNAAVRRALVRELGPLWQQLVGGFRLQVRRGRLGALIAPGGADLETLLRSWDTEVGGWLATAFRDAIEAGGRLGARHAGVSGGVSAQGLTERARRWIETEGAQRVARINASTRAGVRAAVSEVLADRLSPTEAAARIGDLTGLTRAQARALRRYEERLERTRIPTEEADTPKVRASIEQDVERYRGRLLRRRGATIIETEGQAAVQAGERLWWEQAGEEGLVQLSETRKRWVTVEDERVCPICEPLHDVVIDFAELFRSGDFVGEGPPAHPRCRCFLEYEGAT